MSNQPAPAQNGLSQGHFGPLPGTKRCPSPTRPPGQKKQKTTSQPEPMTAGAQTQPALETRPRHRSHPAHFWCSKPVRDNRENAPTLLFRPTGSRTLHQIPMLQLARAFNQLPTKPTATRKIYNGGFALDFPEETDLSPLLSVKSLADIPVKAALPRTRNEVWGTVRASYDSADDVQEAINMHEKNPAVLQVRQLGKTQVFAIQFDTSPRPDELTLCYEKTTVHAYYDQPTRCFKCQRFGHKSGLCRSKEYCGRCGHQGHSYKNCQSQDTWCINCGGNHDTASKTCPHRQFETQVNKTAAKTGEFRPEVRKRLAVAFAEVYKKRKQERSPQTSEQQASKPTTRKQAASKPQDKTSYAQAVAKPVQAREIATQTTSQQKPAQARETATQTISQDKPKPETSQPTFPMRLFQPMQDAVGRLMTVGEEDFSPEILQRRVQDLFDVLERAQDYFESIDDHSDM